jgi:hypothetical protein
MTTSVDTNVFVALWHPDNSLNTIAKSAMDNELVRGNLVISPPGLAELMASRKRRESFVDYFLNQAGIAVDGN